MDNLDAKQFWKRFRELAKQDLPVLEKTGIRNSTLSTWRKRNSFPRADDAYRIAKALNVTVEYLVAGVERNSEMTNCE